MPWTGTITVLVAVRLDRFFRVHGMRPRDDAKRRRGFSPLAVNEIPDQVRNDSRGRNGGIMRFPLRGNGVIITRYHAAA